ncbi:hypothetical protein ZWY2020_036830 [Hordeum vulgare]|nr:hypothetical protein ZWY2020_036803 [Hordeum vulgare]KAI4989513.1 hypothetical protein ZWY2020_036830 [Hordeum vulgare]
MTSSASGWIRRCVRRDLTPEQNSNAADERIPATTGDAGAGAGNRALTGHGSRFSVEELARTMVAAGFVFVPGTWSGFALRVGQCGFSATSGRIMLTSLASLTYSRAYMYLIFVMVLHFVWSLVQAVVYLRTLLAGEDIHRPGIAFFLALGDGAVALLTSSAVSVSAMVTVLFVNDTGACGSFPELACDRYQLSVVLGSVAWFLQATSAFSNLCLMIKVATQQPH